VGVLLIPRTVFHDLGGYDERNILFNHMEHELIARLRTRAEVQDLGRKLDYDFYHQFHSVEGSRPENPWIDDETLARATLRPNGERWGLLANPNRVNLVAVKRAGVRIARRYLGWTWRR
jgi:hypothetical protein